MISFTADPGAVLNDWILQIGGDAYGLGEASVLERRLHRYVLGAAVAWSAADVGDKVSISLRDSRKPKLSTASPPAVNGRFLVLTFDEALDADSVPNEGQFTVAVNSASRTVSSVAIRGKRATLTLAKATVAGETVTVSYAQPASNPLRDRDRNEVADFDDRPVANNSAACPSGQPDDAFWTACLTLGHLDEAIGFSPFFGALSDPTFTRDGAGYGIDVLARTEAGMLLSFTGDPGAALNDWVLQIGGDTHDLRRAASQPGSQHSYRIGAANGWTAADAGDKVSVSLRAPDWTAPTLSTATPPAVDGRFLVLTFDEALDADSVPAASAFTVAVDSASRTVSSVAPSGRTATLRLAEATVAGETVTVSYAKPASNPFKDPSGNEVADFDDRPVTNNSAACPSGQPDDAFWTACLTLGHISGSYVGFSGVSGSARGALSDPMFTRGNASYEFDYLSRSWVFGGTVRLSFTADPGAALGRWILQIGSDVHWLSAAEPVFGAIDAHSYSAPSVRGWTAADAGDKVSVSLRLSDNTPPALDSAAVEAKSLVLIFDEDLDTDSELAASAFTVEVNKVSRTVSSAATRGKRATLTLAEAVIGGETVTVSYAKPASNPLQDPSGNEVADFDERPVANNSAACPSGQPDDAFWSACLTIGRQGSVIGFASAYGDLSDPIFSHHGADYEIDVLARTGAGMRLSFTGDPGAALRGWVLRVGSDTYHLGEATVGAGSQHTYDIGAANGWTAANVGDKVSVSLRDGRKPALDAATPPAVGAKSLVLTFDEALATDSEPAASAFTVAVDSASRTVEAVDIRGREVTLTLAEATVAGEVVTVSYAKPVSNPLTDPSGNEVAEFDGRPVTNHSAACPSGQPADAFWTACLTLGEGFSTIGFYQIRLRRPLGPDVHPPRHRLRDRRHCPVCLHRDVPYIHRRPRRRPGGGLGAADRQRHL